MEKNCKVVILSAGKGSRMRPLSTFIKKPLLPIVDTPILFKICESFIRNGCSQIALIYDEDLDGFKALSTQIKEQYTQDLDEPLQIELIQQKEPNGMAAALSLAKNWVQKDGRDTPVFVTAADVLFDNETHEKMLTAHLEANAEITLSLVHSEDSSMAEAHASVALDENQIITQIMEKPGKEKLSSHYSMPLYLFNSSVFSKLENLKESVRGEKELQDVIQGSIDEDQKVIGVALLEDIEVSAENIGQYHLTTPLDVLKMNLRFLSDYKLKLEFSGEYATVLEPVFLDQVELEDSVLLGPNVIVHRGCICRDLVELQDSVVFSNAEIGRKTTLKRCIVAPNTKVPEEGRFADKLFYYDAASKETEIVDLF